MGTAVLAYDRNVVDEAAQLAVSEQSPTQTGPRVSTGLSVFDVPMGVTVHLFPAENRCELQFDYPNRELGEPTWRAIEEDGSVVACIGRHSAKVLRIRVDNAREVFSGPGLVFDPDIASDWVRSRPSNVQKTGLINAVIISRLIEQMPSRVRNGIVSMLPSLG